MPTVYRFRRFIFISLFSHLSWLICAVAAARGLPAVVAASLERSGIPVSAAGVFVQAVDSRKAWMRSNQDLPFNPASVMKLVTTNAALDLLGPVFTWKTEAYIDGSLNGDVLSGDLIIKGGGDPKLVTENFWQFLRQIRARGIRE